MPGGYKFGRNGAALSPETIRTFEWFLLALVYAAVTWLITRLLVRLGKAAPQREMNAWLKVMGAGLMVLIVLLILADEFLI